MINILYTLVNKLYTIINRFYIVVNNLYTMVNKLFTKTKGIFINSFKMDIKLNENKKVRCFCIKLVQKRIFQPFCYIFKEKKKKKKKKDINFWGFKIWPFC